MKIDLEVLGKERLQKDGVPPDLKVGARLLRGRDVFAELPIMPIDEWAFERMMTSCWKIIRTFDRPREVHLPIGFPRPDDEWFGYLNRTIRDSTGVERPSTRNLVRVIGWAATALVTWQRKIHVPTKRDCHLMYRQHIGDDWCDLIDALYTDCRAEWLYLIPEGAEGRARLQAICHDALAFENDFLLKFREFAIEQLSCANGKWRSRIKWVLRENPLVNAAIVRALANA